MRIFQLSGILAPAALAGILACALPVVPAVADSLDLNLHGDAVRVTYARQGMIGQGLDFDLGLLHAEKHRQRANVVHAGLQVSGQNWSRQGDFDISVGGRAVYVDARGGIDGLAAALGGSVRFTPISRIGFGGSVYHAPKIISFMDIDRYTEWGVFADYQLLEQAFVYVGYRNVRIKPEHAPTAKLDKDAHIGMRILF